MTQRAPATFDRRTAVYWATGVGATSIIAFFSGGTWQGNFDLHTDMEIIATVVAVIIGAMALARFYSKKETTFLLLGCGFVGTAFLDAYHALVTSEFLPGMIESELMSPAPWSWRAARYFLAISIFLSWLAWRREDRLGPQGRIDEKTVYLATVAVVAVVVLVLAVAPLPAGNFPEFYIRQPGELGSALLFLAALVGYLRKGLWRRDLFEHFLVISLILGVVGQAVMSLSGTPFDYEFNVGHLLKIAGYGCVLVGLLGNTLAIYREAEESERRFRSAISNMQEGFALFDADDRLVTYNDEYLRLHPGLVDIIRPGIRFEDMLRVNVERGMLVEAIGREEEFIRERIRDHRNPRGPILRELSDGTWYLINEALMPDGGIAVTETDITELKDAETALRAREKLTREMLEASPVGVLIVTREGRHLFANERALEIQGISRDQLMASNAGDFYADPGLRKRLKDELYRSGATPPTQVELLKPDGTRYFVILTSTVTEFDGQPAHLTYLYDIDDLRRAQDAARQSEALLRTIMDSVPALINVKDTEGRYLLVNRHHSDFFGVSSNAWIGLTSEVISKEHGQHVDGLNRTILHTGEPVPPYDYKINDSQGRERYILTIKVPLRGLADEIIGIVTTSIDITDRKRTEQALRDNEARTRAVVDNIIDGIVTIDTAGVILSVNPAAARIFGYDELELVGHNVSTLMPEPHRSGHDRYLANYLTTGVPKFMGAVREVEGRHRNGRRFPMEVAVNEVSIGHERLFVGIVRDITERKEMERLKGEFVSTVSHELRTPLTSIRGSLGLLAGGVIGKLPKKALAMIELAENNTARLIALVNDILDMEKVESGKMEFRFGAVDLKNLVDQGIEANRGYAEGFDVDFAVTETAPGIVVRGDADRLTQVLANLLSNAAKFSPRGGKVEIAIARRGAVARLSVSDRGPGIPKEFESQIFGKFTQADSSDARKVGGTGLGLNISKSIIEKHGGRLAFDTTLGAGTTFYFEVPVWDGPIEAAAEAARRRRHSKVLSR